MANTWFRMYVDFLDDPKIIGLAFEDQRHFIGILALKSAGVIDSNCDEKLMDRIVSQRLWVDFAIISDIKRRLMNAGLIETNWQPIAWNKRQFVSDHDISGAERQRRHREKLREESAKTLRNVTGNGDSNALRNGAVTLPDTDTDTELTTSKDVVVIGDANPSISIKKNIPSCPHQKIIELYEKNLPELPLPAIWDGARANSLKARWKWVLTAKKKNGEPRAKTESEALDFFDRMFAYVSESDFLSGRNGKWQGCDLGWLVKSENFSKVISGNYDNTKAVP